MTARPVYANGGGGDGGDGDGDGYRDGDVTKRSRLNLRRVLTNLNKIFCVDCDRSFDHGAVRMQMGTMNSHGCQMGPERQSTFLG